MKHILFGFLTLSALTILSCCKEVGPEINLHGGSGSVADTTYIESPVASAEAKNVLIEEFTGVQCPNCPAGHAQVVTLKSQYPGRVTGIALHPSNALGYPYPYSAQNLIDASSTTLLNYLGSPGFEPCAGIDRQLFSNQTNILTDRNYWAGFTAQELALSPKVNILLSDAYNASTNVVTVVAELHYTQDVTQVNNITVALTEDSIVTAQLNGATVDTFYVHNDALRMLLTGNTGDNVAYNANVTLVAGRVVRLVYQATLKPAWKPEHMHVVAYVHEHASSQVVYQVKEIKLTN